MLVMPRTKQIASRMLDLPLPLRPVIELKLSSLRPSVSPRLPRTVARSGLFTYHPEMTVRTAYDLKPCTNQSDKVVAHYGQVYEHQ